MDPDRHSLADALAPHLHRLATPALVLDLDAVDHNIAAVVRRCGPDRWRPHVKTIKSAALVERLFHHGVTRCKVATLDELDLVLATADRLGRTADVLVAYPPHEPALRAILARGERSPRARVHVLLDGPEHAAAVADWLRRTPAATHDEVDRLAVMLDVDVGMARTGSPAGAWRAAAAALVSPVLEVTGLHGYEGHLEWDAAAEAAAAHDALCDLARDLTAAGLSSLRTIVTSGTHAYAHALAHPGLSQGPWQHQISPGTVVLSDLRSSPAAADLGLRQAAVVAARVISRGPGRVTLDCGSKAIHPDRGPCGRILGWPGLEPARASEEHLVVRHAVGADAPALGELVFVVPDHVCTTVNLYRRAVLLRAGAVVGDAAIEAASHRLWLEDP
ncbi:MAG: alanine racemase [Myxococcales bacterium]|nr:alanine racemase [Myxococcales bacterium]